MGARDFVFPLLFLLGFCCATNFFGEMNDSRQTVDAIAHYHKFFKCTELCHAANPNMRDDVHARYECLKPCYKSIFVPNIVQLD